MKQLLLSAVILMSLHASSQTSANLTKGIPFNIFKRYN